MQKFYNKALIGLLCLVLASVLIGYTCLRATYIRLELLPAAESALAWHAEAASDVSAGGHSTVKILDATSTLSFDVTVSGTYAYPYGSFELVFHDRAGKPAFVDLSRYSAIAFDAQCAPANTLTFGVLVLDEGVSELGKLLTYRMPSVYFFCGKNGGHVELDMAHLKTDQWWFDRYKVNLSNQDYKLNKVSKLSFATSFQSPYGVQSQILLKGVTLIGRDMRYLYLFGAFMPLAWGAYALWFFRRHTQALTAEVRDKIRRDIPLVAYQQLSQELHRDKEKSAILRFMATEYANPDLDFDAMVTALGLNRNKINEILKAELGYTFSTYLNKLRLTEAARLLGEKEESSVAEIAYAVGYRNVSYFNKLFKEEYGCTPKVFRTLREP